MNGPNVTHANGSIDINIVAQYGGSYSGTPQPGDPYGACSATFCHGGSSPQWGTDFSGIDQCTKCHGIPTAAPAPHSAKAPPKDTSGDTSDTDPQVGAHQAHLQSLNGYTDGISCSECHVVPANVDDPGHFDTSLPAELTFGALASNNGATPGYSAGQCLNTYCHGNEMPRGSNNGNNTTPTWNDPAYLTGTPGLAGDCSQCHGAPPNIAPHTGGETLNDCAACHPHFNADGTLNDPGLHINGLLEAAGDCTSCHSAQQGTGRRNVVGIDLVKTSHHINETTGLDEGSCKACHGDLVSDLGHPGTATADPDTQLKTPDTGVYITVNGVTGLETFCANCHDSDGASRLGTDALNPFTDSGDNTPPPDIGWTASSMSHGFADACFNCHGNSGAAGGTLDPVGNAHGSDSAFLLQFNNFTAGASQTFCYNCHDGSVASTNIQAIFGRTFKHGEEDCQNCHNQHTAQPGTHTPPGQWYPSSPNANTNNVSGVLSGVTGVEPNFGSIWTQPGSFTELDSAIKEYQICFKCHSNYNGGPVSVTNQALEYNPNNKSAHPVVVTLNNQSGSYSPKALSSSQMKSPWTNVGNQTMYCADCHGTDNEDSGDPRGPHGSSFEFLHKGPNKLWPIGNAGVPFSLNDMANDNSSDGIPNNTNVRSTLFCLNCHDSFPSRNKDTWKNKVHEEHDDRDYKPEGGSGWGGRGDHDNSSKHNVYCIACHSVVPHGMQRSRFIVYRSEPAPYTYQSGGTNFGIIVGFRKTSRFNYDKDNCRTAANLGCDKHEDRTNTFDP
ncbi:MAG: CxxxxCH/CxxCH domain c-type cytochrome [Planctomycetota bacterium]